MKWITREHVKVDRVACPWLIRKFVDPEAGRDAIGSRRRGVLEGVARRAGFAFFAPAPWNEQDEYIARVHPRAEMVTPVLEGILAHTSVCPAPEHQSWA